MRALTDVDPGLLSNLCRAEEFFWLDLDDPDDGTIEKLGQTLGLHELALEDSRKFGQRPKVEAFGDQLLLVYFGARTDEDGLPAPVEVHLHVSGRFVVSVHRERCQHFDRVRQTLKESPPANEERVVYQVLDALTDSMMDVLDEVANTIECYETEVFNHPRARDRDRMAELRRTLGRLRRIVSVQRQVFVRVADHIVHLPGLERDLGAYYRDVEDHLARVMDEVEEARETLQGMLDTYTNEVQERLTIVATIFLPLTVLTGFFGMNFSWLINHIGAAGTFFGLGLGGMLAAAVTIVLWLKRTGLLHTRRR